jgi:hypothetical protein
VIESCPTGSGSMPYRRHVQIMREGHEVASDEDDPRASLGSMLLARLAIVV